MVLITELLVVSFDFDNQRYNMKFAQDGTNVIVLRKRPCEETRRSVAMKASK